MVNVMRHVYEETIFQKTDHSALSICCPKKYIIYIMIDISRVSNIESDNSQNVVFEDYNNISDGIFPYFTTPSIKITLGPVEKQQP